MSRNLNAGMALAEALRLARVSVVVSYPATFRIPVVESLSACCTTKTSTMRFLNLNNERSAIAACTGAASTGMRVFALACGGAVPLMNELASWTSTVACPLVVAEINRMDAPPWDIWAELRENAAVERMGWIRLSCECNQEVFDTILQAYRLEALVNAPVSIVLDDLGYGRDLAPVEIPEQGTVDLFLARQASKNAAPETGMCPPQPRETQRDASATMKHILECFRNVEKRFQKYFNRRYGAAEVFQCDDAEIIMVTTGVTARIGREVVRRRRAGGENVGLMRIRLLRPFPAGLVRRILGPARKIAVIDRDLSLGSRTLLARGIAAALGGVHNPPVVFNYITGMDHNNAVGSDTVEEIYEMTKRNTSASEESIWMRSQRTPINNII